VRVPGGTLHSVPTDESMYVLLKKVKQDVQKLTQDVHKCITASQTAANTWNDLLNVDFEIQQLPAIEHKYAQDKINVMLMDIANQDKVRQARG
jgi:hypothetical protein